MSEEICAKLLTVPSLLALRLKLAQAFQYALPFRRLCLFFLGGFLFFPDLPLPCGKVTIVLLHDSLRLAVGCHERLHIGITVLFQNIGQFDEIKQMAIDGVTSCMKI